MHPPPNPPRPKSRWDSRWAGAALFALAVGCTCADTAPPPAAPPDHVVLVVVDTLRADFTSPYGRPGATTPHLQALADQGLVFERAYSHAPWTLPSFVSLFTGTHPSRHGATRIDGALAFSSADPTLPTLAQLYAGQGMRTGLFAASAFVSNMSEGFDTVHRRLDQGADEVVAEALAWSLSSDAPSLTVITLMEPHLPYDPADNHRQRLVQQKPPWPFYEHPPPGATLFEMYRKGIPPWDRQAEILLALYDAEVATADEAIGQLMEGLKEAGRKPNTVLMVTSDHGEEFWEHGGFEHGHALHGEVLRVPLVVAGPGISAGRVQTPVQHADVFQWLLALQGVPAPADTVGTSIMDLAQAEQEDGPQLDRPLLAESTLYGSELAAITVGQQRLIVDLGAPGAPSTLWTTDAYGQADVQVQRPTPAATRVLADQLRALRGSMAPPKAAEAAVHEPTAQELQQLQQLGYLDP